MKTPRFACAKFTPSIVSLSAGLSTLLLGNTQSVFRHFLVGFDCSTVGHWSVKERLEQGDIQ